MEFSHKLQILKYLDTKSLCENILKLEDELEQKTREDISFRHSNAGYLAALGSDCNEVKQRLAQLAVSAPEVDGEGKKYTAPQKEAWLVSRRVKDDQLVKDLQKQKDVAFHVENNRVGIEMKKKRLESMRVVVTLKTAQINFLVD